MNADQYAEEYKKVEASFGLDHALTWLFTSLMQRAIDLACERAHVKFEDVKAGKAFVKDEIMRSAAKETIQMWRKIARKNPELKEGGYEELLKRKGLL